MDQAPTPLAGLVRELASSERFRAFADAFPANARVSEPALPLVLATLHAALERPLTCLLAEDEEARDVAEAIGWYVDPATVALLPSRGVSAGSGLEPPAHLVGERARALEVLAARGLVCISARALAEGMPPAEERPGVVRLTSTAARDLDTLVEELALAGYERVERVEERGQIAVRDGLVDVFPSTGREPLRVEFFGDEIDRIRAFSPFTQRALHPVEDAVVYPARERAPDAESELGDDERARVPLLDGPPDLVWQIDDVLSVWDDVAVGRPSLDGAALLDALPRSQPHVFEAQRPAIAARGLAEAENELAAMVKQGRRVVVTFPHQGEALRTQRLLRKVDAAVSTAIEELPPQPSLAFIVSPARRGFVWRDLGIALLPDTQVFRKRPPRTDTRLGRALQSFADLRTGDYVVHEDHGIARFAGFETKTVAGVTRDYLELEYRGSDRVFAPTDQLAKITRYVGTGGEPPQLSALGSKRWEGVKARARRAARELAGELLNLYAERRTRTGHPFPPDGEWQMQLERAFPYRETTDQLEAIEAVKADMEAARPMDRLICGDVGYGKTEVALRAAHKAVSDGRQVMMLVPTTILAQQHLGTFRERLAEFPIEVEMVSRLRKPAEVRQTLARFAEGKVDVLIGTHRLLSRDVRARDLGLLIVDEEQRFGVRQKELLRQLKLKVDVLSLSATPIPRTLQMSLAGLRDISVIETPPEGRRPIRTYVGPYDEELVRRAIEREKARGGQAFFLHNRIDTLHEVAERLRALCPGVRFAEAHGRMDETELERTMLEFLRGDADCLVATTIIESGLDIPQANTLIVERADELGLAQAYQIRGRVGRSRERAYAYLHYPSEEALSRESGARLATLSDYTELGSGFAIAMRDLELRGAGNLLGDEQSGHVAAVGFELYVSLLDDAVEELRSADGAHVAEAAVRLDVDVDAYLPADYIPFEAAKIDVHRRISGAADTGELRALRDELRDRFGPVPEPVENLMELQRARIELGVLGARTVEFRGGRLSVTPLELDAATVGRLREGMPEAMYESREKTLSVRVPDEPAARLAAALALAEAVRGAVAEPVAASPLT
jgi:transcription-repair coupling factor (superfamily II helicase)